MDAAAHKQRTRSVSPLSGGSVETRSLNNADIILKSGNLFLHQLFATSEVAPDGIVDVSLTVSNGQNNIPPGPDCCGPFCNDLFPGDWSSNGWQYKVTVVLDGVTRETDLLCLGGTEVGTNDNQHQFSIPAPTEPGGYDMSITMEMPSGEIGTAHRSVAVQSDGDIRPGPEQCSTNDDCPGGWVCEDGSCVPEDDGGGGGGALLPCFIDPNRACASPEVIAWSIVGLVVLAVTVDIGSITA